MIQPADYLCWLDNKIESMVRRVERDERELGVLSTGEQIAVCVVLDWRDRVPPPYHDSWQDALDRLGEDWLAACRRVAAARNMLDVMAEKKKKASGVNIPEAQRGTERLIIRVPPDVKEEFEELAIRWGLTHGGTLARLLEERGR